MNVISLGSNCEVSDMINKYMSHYSFYTHLFAWSNITIKGINYFLKNPNLLNIDNFIIIYRLIDNNNNNISKNGSHYCDFDELLKDIKIFQNIISVHIDICYNISNIQCWTHGIQIDINNFNEYNKDQYSKDVKDKTLHIINKTLQIINNNEIKLYCIKCLKNEYNLQDIIDLNNLILEYSSNNYISIIVEKDENINVDNLKLTNTCIVSSPKLTGHHEAVYSYLYNTYIYYEQLFENTQIMLNLKLDFYRSYYKDLSHMTDHELITHYNNFGKKEGRFISSKQLENI